MTKEFTPTPEEAIYYLSFLPSRPDYDLWISIIAAIGNTFDESTALAILSTKFRDERPDEHLYKMKHKLSDVNFGTLVHLAKQNGCKQTYRRNNHKSSFDKKSRPVKSSFSRKYNLKDNKKEFLYKFIDEELEERASIYEFEAGLSRSEAEKKVIEENPGALYRRAYRIAINRSVLNKNLNPKTKEPHPNFSNLTNDFENYVLDEHEIAYCIGSGYSICCSMLKGKRLIENWITSELFAIDIDNTKPVLDSNGKPLKDSNGKTIKEIDEENYQSINDILSIELTKRALLIYTSASHTPEHHRFRILFDLPFQIYDSEAYKKIIERHIEYYKADKAASSIVNAFYGNYNADIVMIRTKEVLRFREGKLI